MATSEQYAQWIVDNQDKKGTPDFETVAAAYKASRSAPVEVKPEQPKEKDMQSWATLPANATNKMLANTFDAVLNTPTNIANLAGAGAGYIGSKLGIDPQHLPSADFQPPNIAHKLLSPVISDKQMTPTQQTADKAIQAGTAMLLNPAQGVRQASANVATGALSGGAGDVVGQITGSPLAELATNIVVPMATAKIASSISAKANSSKEANVTRDATVKDARDVGYVIPPSAAGKGSTLEALSGKYKTEQMSAIKNQEITDKLVRQHLALPENTQITPELLQNIRSEVSNATYEPIRSVGQIKTDNNFVDDLNSILSKRQGASASFPNATKQDVRELINSHRVRQFDSSDALDQISNLRNAAKDAYRAGNSNLGGASKDLANALEDQVERKLTSMGADGETALQNFRNGREYMAKTYTVENALKEGTGHVDAQQIAKDFRKGAPLTGELKQIGKFADTFKKISRIPEGGDSNPFTIMDAVTAAAGAGGSALTMNPLLMGLPLARVGSRYAMLSKPYQNNFASPSYNRPIADLLRNANPNQVAGMTGAMNPNQLGEQLRRK